MRPGSTSLATRVAVATAVSAAGAALVAAASAAFIADRLVGDAEDRRLLATAAMVAGELPESAHEDALRRAVEHEEGELAPAAVRLAVYEGTRLAGGDASSDSYCFSGEK